MIQNILSNVISIVSFNKRKENDLQKLYEIEKEIYSNSLTKEQKKIIDRIFRED